MVAGSVFVSIRNSFVEEGGRGSFFFYIPTCINMLGVGGVVIVLVVTGCVCVVTRRGRRAGGVLYISSWLIYIIRKLIVGGGR